MEKLQPIKGAVKAKFNLTTYNLADGIAKKTISDYLIKNGHEIINMKENYWFDIESKKNDNIYYSEVEIKSGWKGDWNPSWKEIRIPYRKRRLINKIQDMEGDNIFFNFYVLRQDLKKAWRIKDNIVAESEVKEAYGRYITKGEVFFHIPYEKAELVET
jgi:hypothetical protein|tara:strand:+ start:2961 stop:3437 length:477 start_codon:yes stop_codon:yes gene_type:complete